MQMLIKEISQPAIIKVVGVGGGGNNAIDRMIAEGVTGVDFIGINTDYQVLRECKAQRLIEIGEKVSGGKGVGGNPELGKQAAEESFDLIKEALSGADMVIITTGMGGGTGTGAAPVVARAAREMNCLTIGVVTMPFEVERRDEIAELGIENMRQWTDSMIIIHNDKVFNIIEGLSVKGMYGIIDDVLRQAVQSITGIITGKGQINRDFNDVKAVLKDSQTAIIGIGECSSQEDPKEAIYRAIKHPMFENYDISKAKKLLINMVTSSKMDAAKIPEIHKAIESFNTMSEFPRVIGHAFEDRLDDKIRIVIIATGFKYSYGLRKPMNKFARDAKNKSKNKTDNKSAELFPLDQEFEKKETLMFDKPAYEVWKQTGRLERK
ncbi:MAG: cell division protein FtsZ [Elusimicrobiota bacterium]|jgi:cell division protein FtsZ|nr:cell division protein FtsZ [Elusimicrobiota bacterium]